MAAFLIFRCPECWRVTEWRPPGRWYCAGSMCGPEPWAPEEGEHPSVEMDTVRVVAVEEVARAFEEEAIMGGVHGAAAVRVRWGLD